MNFCRAPAASIFVGDALAAGGIRVRDRNNPRLYPQAAVWGNRNASISGFRVLEEGEAPRAGDIISNGDHMGIYEPGPNGARWTVSAAAPESGHNEVVHNDWGFRPPSHPHYQGPVAMKASEEKEGRIRMGGLVARLGSIVMSYALRLVSMTIGYIVGTRLTGATLQWGMDMGLGFWGVWAIALRPQTYSFGYMMLVAIVIAPLLLGDVTTRGRLHPVALAIATAVSGAYYYVMFFHYNKAYELELSYDGFFQDTLPPALADIAGSVCFIVLAFLPPILLIAGKLFVQIGGRKEISQV